MKRFVVVLLIGLACAALPLGVAAQAARAWQSVQHFPSVNYTIARNGDYLVCNNFRDSVWSPSDGYVRSHGTSSDLYFARYSPAGQLLWLHAFGGKDNEDVSQLLEDGEGNVYLVATAYDTTYVSGRTIYPMDSPAYWNGQRRYAHYGDLVVMKYDAAGGFKWLKQMGGAFGDVATGVIGPKNDLYLWGVFDFGDDKNTANSKLARFDTLTVSGNRCSNPFLARFDADGRIKWVRIPTSPNDCGIGGHIAVDGKGGIYCDGLADDKLTFGTVQMNYPPNYSGPNTMFLMKFDTAGQALWGTVAGSDVNTLLPRPPTPTGFAVDTATGCTFISGNIATTSRVGSTTLQKLSPDFSPFLAKFSPTGACLWAENAGVLHSGDTRAYGLALDRNGDAYATGYFDGTGTFGGQGIAAQGSDDIMVCKYSGSNGAPVWIAQASVGGGYGLWTDAAYNVYVVGAADSDARFGTVAFHNSRPMGFLAQLAQPGLGLGVATPFQVTNASSVSVYPNPASGAFSVAWRGTGYDRLVLTNNVGSNVYEQPIAPGTERLNIPSLGLPSGMYFLLLTGQAGTQTVKITIRS